MLSAEAQYTREQERPEEDGVTADVHDYRCGCILEFLSNPGCKKRTRHQADQAPLHSNMEHERPEQAVDNPCPPSLSKFLTWQDVSSPQEFFSNHTNQAQGNPQP